MAQEKTEERERYYIQNGPGKFDLMVALFDGDGGHRKSVEFTVKIGNEAKQVPVIIEEISREDGSGENWCIAGRTATTSLNIHGYFSTKTRGGFLEKILTSQADYRKALA